MQQGGAVLRRPVRQQVALAHALRHRPAHCPARQHAGEEAGVADEEIAQRRLAAQPEGPRQLLRFRQMERRRVEEYQPADFLREARGIGHADHAAPVVHQERDAPVDVHLLDQRGEIVDAAAQRVVVALFIRFFGQPAADVIGRDHAVRAAQAEHQVAKVERPGGIAMQHDHGVALAFVERVHLVAVHVAVGPGERVERVLERGHVTTPAPSSGRSGRCRCRESRPAGRP